MEALKNAESEVDVADHLEIVEDTPRLLMMRVHTRKYKTKITMGELRIFIFVFSVVLGLSIPLFINYFHFSRASSALCIPGLLLC